MDAHKICFITCVTDEAAYNQSLRYLKRLRVPDGYTVESLVIGQAASMAEGYEAGRKASDAKYKIYLHQDVHILARDFLETLVRAFRAHPEYGIAGAVGGRDIPTSIFWWESEMRGMIADELTGRMEPRIYPHDREKCLPVAALDGLILATQYDVPWREDVFTGFDMYDLSACMEYRRRGYQAVVLPGAKPLVEHCSGTKPRPALSEAQLQFLQEYGQDVWLGEGYRLSVLVVASQTQELARCLSFLGEACRDLSMPHEVIVVDDGAGGVDTSKDYLLLHHTRPQGLAKSFQEAAQRATGNLFCLLTSDVCLPRLALRRLFAALGYQHCGVALPTMRSQAPETRYGLEIPPYQDRQDFLEQAEKFAYSGYLPQQVTTLPASLMLVRRETWEKLDGFAGLEAKNFSDLVQNFCLRVGREDEFVCHAIDALVAP